MTTLRDLSRHLGLSITQVSRALNGHGDVSASTRDRVRAAARALNYQPNLMARRLASGRSGLMALVMPGASRSHDDALFVQVVTGISQGLSRLDRQLVLHIASPGEDMVDVYRRLIAVGGIAGFVLLEPETRDRRAEFLRRAGVPFVVHGRLGEDAAHPFFDIDNEAVGRCLAQLLIARGHRRVAFLNGPEGKHYAEARRKGYLAAFAAAGLLPDPGLHRSLEMTEGAGLVAGVSLLSDGGPAPSAVICGSMRLARGLLEAARAIGLRVPQDLSVVVHDDALPGLRPEACNPPLTATYAPLSQAWEPLAEILVAATERVEGAALQRLGQTTLTERASVAWREGHGGR